MFHFLISQQKYLELLESQNVNTALQVLRNELAVFNAGVDELHSLSRYSKLYYLLKALAYQYFKPYYVF